MKSNQSQPVLDVVFNARSATRQERKPATTTHCNAQPVRFTRRVGPTSPLTDQKKTGLTLMELDNAYRCQHTYRAVYDYRTDNYFIRPTYENIRFKDIHAAKMAIVYRLSGRRGDTWD